MSEELSHGRTRKPHTGGDVNLAQILLVIEFESINSLLVALIHVYSLLALAAPRSRHGLQNNPAGSERAPLGNLDCT